MVRAPLPQAHLSQPLELPRGSGLCTTFSLCQEQGAPASSSLAWPFGGLQHSGPGVPFAEPPSVHPAHGKWAGGQSRGSRAAPPSTEHLLPSGRRDEGRSPPNGPTSPAELAEGGVSAGPNRRQGQAPGGQTRPLPPGGAGTSEPLRVGSPSHEDVGAAGLPCSHPPSQAGPAHPPVRGGESGPSSGLCPVPRERAEVAGVGAGRPGGGVGVPKAGWLPHPQPSALPPTLPRSLGHRRVTQSLWPTHSPIPLLPPEAVKAPPVRPPPASGHPLLSPLSHSPPLIITLPPPNASHFTPWTPCAHPLCAPSPPDPPSSAPLSLCLPAPTRHALAPYPVITSALVRPQFVQVGLTVRPPATQPHRPLSPARPRECAQTHPPRLSAVRHRVAGQHTLVPLLVIRLPPPSSDRPPPPPSARLDPLPQPVPPPATARPGHRP